MKIKVTDDAKKMIKKTLGDRDLSESFVRIYIQAFGWGGPKFGIALDEQKENDYIVKDDELNYVVEKDLIDRYGGFEVDYSKGWLYKGFEVRTNKGGSSC